MRRAIIRELKKEAKRKGLRKFELKRFLQLAFSGAPGAGSIQAL